MSRLMIARVRLFVIQVTLFTLIGMADGFFGSLDEGNAVHAALRNGLNWMVGSILVWGFENFFVPSRYGVFIRRMNFLAAIAFKSTILVLVVFIIRISRHRIYSIF